MCSRISVVYFIKNNIDNKGYIGSSINIENRFKYHRSSLSNDKHFNQYLQNAWNKYGADSFEFIILLELNVLESDLRLIEKMYIYNLEPEYNVDKDPTTNPMYGRKHTKESKEKMSKSHIGTSKRFGKDNPFYGKTHTDEEKRNMSIRRRGEGNYSSKLSEEDVLIIRELYSTGNYTKTELSIMFNVTVANIAKIVNRKTWKHI